MGRIVADMFFLKELIQPKEPVGGELHYEVEFAIVMKVDGRNMYFTAEYTDRSIADQNGKGNGRPLDLVEGSRGVISIAASFKPGTR